jgi:ABC-type phosphate transport system substrate-binding protein
LGEWHVSLDVSSPGVQTVLTALTLIGTLVGWLFDRYVVRRRRLSYRVHWNRPVGLMPVAAHGMNLSIVLGGQVIDEPSVVILRVENVGSLDIGASDMTEPLDCTFGGRRIVHYEVQETEPPELADDIMRPRTGPGPELVGYRRGEPGQTPAGVLRLPAFDIARRSRFKLLVLLSGPGTEATLRGRLTGGDVLRESRRGPRSRGGLLLGGASLLLGGLLAGLIVTRPLGTPNPTPDPIACPAPGALSLAGSTTLYPVMSDLAQHYATACPGARIQVTASGTNLALQQLIQGGLADQQTKSSEASRVKLAMADDYAGKPLRDPRLGYWPIAIGAFAVVVNSHTGVTQLSSRQLTDLYDGLLPKWNDSGLAGADQEVVLVSRTSDSGTYDAFAHRVLSHPEKAPVSSSDCLSRDVPDHQADVMHCVVTTTADVLRKVAQTPGAIGYASAAEAAQLHDPALRVIPIDGYFPGKDSVATGRYRFWAVERLYRYGRQLPPTLRDHFVQYVTAQRYALDLLQNAGFYLCNDSAFLDGEAASACRQQDENAHALASPATTPTTG